MANKARTQTGTQSIKAKQLNPIDKLQVWYEKNKKPLNTGTTIIVLAAALIFAYVRLYKGPREEKSATALSYAQRYFNADSLNLALNGDGQHLGFTKIESKYSGTKASNLCHYYAGVCYLHMGDYNSAIKQLKDFNGKGTMLQYAAWGNLGDAYMENNNVSKGIEYYEKATGNKDDIVITPIYLLRMGMAYELNNQQDNAKKAYKRIRDDYPMSMQARDVEKYLARLGELN